MSRRGGSPRGGVKGGGHTNKQRSYSTATKKAPPPPPPAPASGQPGLFGTMAATAAGVAVGSAVGQVVGSALTGSGARKEVAAASRPEEMRAQEPSPCAEEILQFLKCAEQQEDLNLCVPLNEALKNCKLQYRSSSTAVWNTPLISPKKGWVAVRHIQAVILFFGLTIAYSQRVNLSVGIVAMTDNTTNPQFQTVDWNKAESGEILSSFFYGYFFTQIAAGQLAARIGASKPLGAAMIVNGLSTLIFPYAALQGFVPAFAARVVQGLGQGFIYPCINTLMSKWAVPQERGRIYSFVFGGTQFGTIVILIAGGLLAASSGGWPSIFYVTGGLSVAWGLLCLLFVADSPDTHKTISNEERMFIEMNLISTSKKNDRPPTPWLDMLKSIPLWALFLVHLSQNWGFWTLLTLMPTYINDVLHFEIKKNGLLSALPYFTMWIMSFIFSMISDLLVKKEIVSFGVSRKLWNSIALYGGAVALILLAILESNTINAITLLTVAVGLNAGTYSGYMLNHLDLSPNFAGTLMGITNGFSNITSILAPTIAGYILGNQGNNDQWKIVFFISAGVSLAGQTIFNIFGSGEVQPWNSGPLKNRSTNETSEKEEKY